VEGNEGTQFAVGVVHSGGRGNDETPPAKQLGNVDGSGEFFGGTAGEQDKTYQGKPLYKRGKESPQGRRLVCPGKKFFLLALSVRAGVPGAPFDAWYLDRHQKAGEKAIEDFGQEILVWGEEGSVPQADYTELKEKMYASMVGSSVAV